MGELLKKARGIKDGQIRKAAPKTLISPEVKKVLIPTDQVPSLRGDCKIEVTLVFGVAFQRERLWHVSNHHGPVLHIAQEHLDRFRCQSGQFPPELGAAENVSRFSDDVGADQEPQLAPSDKLIAGTRWTLPLAKA